MEKRRVVTNSVVAEAMLLRAKGWTYGAIARKFGFHESTIRRHCEPVRRETASCYANTSAWVINHPYVNELHEEERVRFLEVIRKRQENNPDMGWDYKTKKQVCYKQESMEIADYVQTDYSKP